MKLRSLYFILAVLAIFCCTMMSCSSVDEMPEMPTEQTPVPEILEVTPLKARPGDTIQIRGKNLGTVISKTNLYIGTTKINMMSLMPGQILFVVPDYCQTGHLSLNVSDGVPIEGPKITIDLTLYVNLLNYTGRAGDTVKMFTKYNSPLLSENQVFFPGDLPAKIIDYTPPYISVIVPEGFIPGRLKVVSRGEEGLSGIYEKSSDYPAIKWTEVYSSASLQKTNMMVSTEDIRLVAGGVDSKYLYLTTSFSGYPNYFFYNVLESLPFEDKAGLLIRKIYRYDNTFYVLTNRGIAKSFNGSTWIKMDIDPKNPNREFSTFIHYGMTAISGSEMFVSNDKGNTWQGFTASNPDDRFPTQLISGGSFSIQKAGIEVSRDPSTGKKGGFCMPEGSKAWSWLPNNIGYNYNKEFPDYLSYYGEGGRVVSSFSTEADPVNRPYGSKTSWGWYERIGKNDEVCDVIKAGPSLTVAYGSTGFNLSLDNGTTFKRYPLPEGYRLGGIDIQNKYFIIMCYNDAGSRKIFHAAR